MAAILRMSVGRRLGESILESRPFGRRPMFEAGGPKARGRGPKMGLNIKISDRDFFDFRGQLADTKRFLRRYDKPLRRLARAPGFFNGSLDFGVGDAIDGGRGDAIVMYFRIPDDIVAMAGRIGVSLEVSVYPVLRRMTKAGLR